jgi:hypothetical protein
MEEKASAGGLNKEAWTKRPLYPMRADLEFSGPDFATSFAQYSLFIVDHPFWDEDQATFGKLLLEAEPIRPPVSGLQLSRLISNSYGIYLFEQAMEFPDMYSSVYPLLFTHVSGEDENLSADYYWALMENGILKIHKEQFAMENKVWLEARAVLGNDEVSEGLKVGEFKDLVSEHLDWLGDGLVFPTLGFIVALLSCSLCHHKWCKINSHEIHCPLFQPGTPSHHCICNVSLALG